MTDLIIDGRQPADIIEARVSALERQVAMLHAERIRPKLGKKMFPDDHISWRERWFLGTGVKVEDG